MTEYDRILWTLRYERYDNAQLESIIAKGGDHAVLARSIVAKRRA